MLFHFWSLHWQTLSFPSEAGQNCSKFCRLLQSHLEIACEQRGGSSSACHQSHASLPVPAASHPAHTSSHPHSSRMARMGPDPALPPGPRQSLLIRHTCWGFSSFIIPKAAFMWLGPRHRKSECLNLLWTPCIRLGKTVEPSVSQLPVSDADSAACPLIHPLSGASAFEDRGVFLWPPW